MAQDESDKLTEKLRSLVREAMERENVGQRRFEELHGLKKWSLRGFLDPEHPQKPNLDRAAEIAAALGLTLSLAPKAAPGFAEAAVAAFQAAGAPEAVTDVFRQGYLPIPWHDLARKDTPPPLAVSLAWLKEHGLVPDDLRFVEVGDTLALIDARAPAHDRPATWCWREDGELHLGLGFRDPGGPFWIADPAGQGPGRLVMPADLDRITFLGRAVWTGRFAPTR